MHTLQLHQEAFTHIRPTFIDFHYEQNISGGLDGSKSLNLTPLIYCEMSTELTIKRKCTEINIHNTVYGEQIC